MNERKRQQIKKILSFCLGFIVLLLVFGIIFISDHWTIGLGCMIFSIPFAFLGLLLWGIFRKINKPLAIGFLLGGILPFSVVFVFTGGCGIFI